MKLATLVKSAAVAGLIGLGVTASTATPASAAETFRRCDSYGCYKVRCDRYRGCYRVGRYYSRAYYPAGYYDDGYYYGRSYRVCDRYGCRWVRGEPRAHVEFGLRF